MAESEQEWISKRAYALWEEEGYPTGKDTEHWERARQEYLLFSPLGVTKGLPKPRKAKATDPAPEKSAAKKAGADTKVAKTKTSKSATSATKTESADPVSVRAPAKTKSPKPAAAAATAKPAVKKSSKKLSTD